MCGCVTRVVLWGASEVRCRKHGCVTQAYLCDKTLASQPHGPVFSRTAWELGQVFSIIGSDRLKPFEGISNLLEGSEFLFREGYKFFNCASGNLIYVIKYMWCHENYIGTIGLTPRCCCTLQITFSEITFSEYTMIPFSGNIERWTKQLPPQFVIFPFWQCVMVSNTSLNKESYFIEKQKTNLNHSWHFKTILKSKCNLFTYNI